MEKEYDASATADWLVCSACGTQFPTTDRSTVTTCFICDDPRQYTPPAGQSFTTLAALRDSGHRNVFAPLVRGGGGGEGGELPSSVFITIATEPKFGIGQRAILVRTPAGNVLWDCLTLLDADTVSRLRSLGGLHAIVISHPHYYGAHAAEWAAAFDGCPVYLAAEDRRWTAMDSDAHVFLGADPRHPGPAHEIEIAGRRSGFFAVRVGGHFPGSMVGLYDGRLLVADTLYTTPAGIGNWHVDAAGRVRERPAGMNSFAFMWSIPNMIPLAADEIARMWEILRRLDFTSTHGAFAGQDVTAPDIKQRVLESMQIQVRNMGWIDHPLLANVV